MGDSNLRDTVRATRATKRVRVLLGAGLAAIAVAAFTVLPQLMPLGDATTGSIAVPVPEVDEPAPAAGGSETAVLAGGCFWGVQGLFQHVNGVRAAESGYAGGTAQTANYETVGTGTTGHAESVRITYDPTQVTYGRLLQIYFSVVADPTQVDGQGPDLGTQYRSAIFAQDDMQKRVATSYIAQLNRSGVFPSSIVTTVSPKAAFFPAERYHQDFMNSNPTEPYIASSEMPKLADLKARFPQQYRQQPVLMLADGR